MKSKSKMKRFLSVIGSIVLVALSQEGGTEAHSRSQYNESWFNPPLGSGSVEQRSGRLRSSTYNRDPIPSQQHPPPPHHPNPPPSRFHPHRRLSPKGTFQNLVLLLRFSDHSTRTLPPRSHYDLLHNSPTAHDIICPTGSVRNYYRDNSHGTFHVDSTVVGWITLNHTEAYYANGDYGFTMLQEAIAEALDGIVLADPSFDFHRFDANGDGIVDGFGILHSGYGAEFGGTDCRGVKDAERIWSHKGGVDWTSPAGIVVDHYYVSSGLRGKCSSDIVRIGVICHELGHYLGLPDLYDGTFLGAGIGAYDVMSQSWGWDGSGTYPPLLSAWSRVRVGWVVPTEIDEDGTYELPAASEGHAAYRVSVGFPDGEYLLIENRQPTGFDAKLPHGGIAVWHIDENVTQGNRGYPDQDQWPENGKHYRVALLSADGRYDLERGVNQGDAQDLWHASSINRELKSGGTKYPNTDSYRGGIVRATGIRIYGFSPSKNVMTFKVEGLGTKKNSTNKPTKVPTASPSRHPVMTESTTAHPTPHPSNKPITQAPITLGPSKEQTSSPFRKPTVKPTDSPRKQPTHNPTSKPIVFTITTPPSHNPTTKSPTPELLRCANVCLEPIPTSECPSNNVYVNCKFSIVGSLCFADGGCGTVITEFNNCNGHSVYKRVECNDDPVIQTPAPSKRPTPTLHAETPTNKPTISIVTGDGAFTSSGSSDDGCMYYPGWSTGLDYCVNDCILPKPSYMVNHPIFEFPDIDTCCQMNYRGTETCRKASAEASAERKGSPTDIELVSVGGSVWNDSNGNEIRDVTEGGVPGVMIDLYECNYNTWVKGTRTSQDGSYLLSRIPPGEYSLKITAPNGYHLVFGENWKNEDFDSMTATTRCREILPLEDNAHFDIGVVPDSSSIVTERVSAAGSHTGDQSEEGSTNSFTHSKTSSANVVPYSITSAHDKSSRAPAFTRPTISEGTSETNENVPVFSVNEETALHAKSFVRGGNVAESDSNFVTLQSVEDATISKPESPTTHDAQDLRISKYEDILVKFDVRFLQDKNPRTALLRLYSLTSSPVGGRVHFASQNGWNSHTITWDSAPEAGDALCEIGPTHPNQWVEVDVTGALDLIQDDLVSLRVSMNESNNYWSAHYSSNRVQLRVYF
ncbi:hypothetical protein ACHAW6_006035 [Cyclotella cf. meneghiniana]